MIKIFLILGLSLISGSLFSAENKYGFCRVQRSASAYNKNDANLTWLELSCFNKLGEPVKGQSNLKGMHITARPYSTDKNPSSRGYPSHLIIDGQKVSNDGIDALDYFDTISGYGKTVEDCKKKFPKLSCKNIGFTLQPGAIIYNHPNSHGPGKLPETCDNSNNGFFSNCIEKAVNQFKDQDFVEACASEGCGRRGKVAKPIVIPTSTDIALESVRRQEADSTISKLDPGTKKCSVNAAKLNKYLDQMGRCISGFRSQQSNIISMYKTVAYYLSCEEFDFISAEVIQEGQHMAAVGRNPAAEEICPLKINFDVDANVGYGTINFKDSTGRVTTVDWDSKFDISTSKNTEPYWRADFGRRLLSTLNSGSSSGSGGRALPQAPGNTNQ